MTTETTASFSKLRALLKKPLILLDAPFDESRSRKSRVFYGVGLGAVLVASLAAAWLFLTWILVGLPQTIVTDTLGTRCQNESGIDCARSIADARQAVLFASGGIIAIIGLYFTYRRWRLEDENTRIAGHEGKRAADRHVREAEQLEIGRITDALGLLDSDDEAKQTAAISLLTDYALHTEEERHARVILDVLKAVVEEDNRKQIRKSEMGISKGLHTSPVAAAAVRGLLQASSKRKIPIELNNLTFRELKAPKSDWSYVTMTSVSILNSYLREARFGGKVPEHSQVRFEATDLNHADFSESKFFSSRFYAADAETVGTSMLMAMTKFTNAELRDVEFHSAWLAQADFTGALLQRVSFADASSVDADSFIGARLTQVSFGSEEAIEGFALLSARGPHPLRDMISPGVVTGVQYPDGWPHLAEEKEPPAPARDRGETPGATPSHEPGTTDVSSA